jgi:predicted phage replisome organizer
MEVKWIKLSTNIFDDEKIQLIEQLPEADAIIVIWFKLLTLAGKQNNDGILMLNDRIPYTIEMLSSIFRRKPMIVQLALETFKAFGMIEITDNVYKLSNWSKHQTLTNRKEYMKNYMKEYRSIGNVNNVNSLQGVNVNRQEEEIELEVEERNKKKEERIIVDGNSISKGDNKGTQGGQMSTDKHFVEELNNDPKLNNTFEELERLIKYNFIKPTGRELTEYEGRLLFDWTKEYPKEYLNFIISELSLNSDDKKNFKYLRGAVVKAYESWIKASTPATRLTKTEIETIELDDVFAELKALKEKGKK